MRYQRSRKPLVQSNWTFHQGRFAIVGSLIVWSLFMLVFGVTSTTAQTGQDERCADFTGQAHGLCTAAVALDCFDDDESQVCEALTTIWNERCRVCEGTPPWEEVTCPCASSGSAIALYEMLAFGVETQCVQFEDDFNSTNLHLSDRSTPGFPVEFFADLQRGETAGCFYHGYDGTGLETLISRPNLTSEEFEACQDEISALVTHIGGCPPVTQ